MNAPDAKNLFSQVSLLHDANVTNAQKTAENAIKIGVLLHQIKETVGHGKFTDSIAENCPTVTDRCCRNYMRLASERMIEEKARALIPLSYSGVVGRGEEAKSETVSVLPAAGKSETVSVLEVLPENAIPAEAYEQARKEVDEMEWLKLPKQAQQSIVKNIRGKDLMELYRDYGIVRAKEIKVYHPPAKLTPDEQIEAENAEAEALLASAERAFDAIFLDLNSKTSILATRIRPARLKDFLRTAVTLNKRLRPLAKRKQSASERNQEALKARWEAAKTKAKPQPVGK